MSKVNPVWVPRVVADMRLAPTLLPKGGAEGEAGPSNTGKVAAIRRSFTGRSRSELSFPREFLEFRQVQPLYVIAF
jgi:hypothetical protein